MLTDAKWSKTYIGYSVDFEHRERQHAGDIKGGARYTSGMLKPLHLVAKVSGFENKSAALRFEYAWKHVVRRARGPAMRSMSLLRLLSLETRMRHIGNASTTPLDLHVDWNVSSAFMISKWKIDPTKHRYACQVRHSFTTTSSWKSRGFTNEVRS